jgi:lauroyl/myristoyl acyltransferase
MNAGNQEKEPEEGVQRQLFDLLRRTVPRVPSRIAMGLAVVTGGLAYRSAGTLRATAHHNMAGLLGLPEGHRRVRRAALGAVCMLTRNYVDMLTVTTLTTDQMRARTEVVGMEHLLEAQARGRGVLIATAHIGNIDAAGHAILVRGARCVALTERVEPDWLFDFFVEERGHFGGEVLPLTANVLPQVQRALRAGLAVGIACDWDMQGNGVPVMLPGFSHAIRIPAGIATLALRGKVPIIPIWPHRLPDGRTRACIGPELDPCSSGHLRTDVRRISTMLAQQMLPRLRAHPQQWVLFHPVWEAPADFATAAR